MSITWQDPDGSNHLYTRRCFVVYACNIVDLINFKFIPKRNYQILPMKPEK